MIQTFGPGNSGSLAKSGDYDGDGKTDLAIHAARLNLFAFRPSSGGPDVVQTFGPPLAHFPLLQQPARFAAAVATPRASVAASRAIASRTPPKVERPLRSQSRSFGPKRFATI